MAERAFLHDHGNGCGNLQVTLAIFVHNFLVIRLAGFKRNDGRLLKFVPSRSLAVISSMLTDRF